VPVIDELLVCPHDREALRVTGSEIVCASGHVFPYVDGIPVLLSPELSETHPAIGCSLVEASTSERAPAPDPPRDEVDPEVQALIGATGGYLYEHLKHGLPRYPIPSLRLPPGHGELFLEVGCAWGRWCIAAAEAGYEPVGIDPSISAIRAARRLADSLDLKAHFIVGDARILPFRDDAFDVAFSYSVLQHFSKENARLALAEIARVTRPGGTSLVQVANALGTRANMQRVRQRFQRSLIWEFRIRYWTPWQLERAFETRVGPSRLEVDGFFSLNAQAADLDLMPPRLRAVIRASECARRLANVVPPLKFAADSLYVRSRVR
jgi:SAM-dependent methyltransferase/uncharacterized protein YbaR (Trm112 family)